MPDRLVIRIKIPSDAQPRVPERRRSSRAALLIIASIAALAIGVAGIVTFRSKPAPVAPAPVVKAEPPAATKPSPVVESKPIAQPAPAPQINEVVPDAPRSARQT